MDLAETLWYRAIFSLDKNSPFLVPCRPSNTPSFSPWAPWRMYYYIYIAMKGVANMSICECNHSMDIHNINGTTCYVVGCECVKYTMSENNTLKRNRYTVEKDSGVYSVIDNTLAECIGYCYKSEYANTIAGALNYQLLLSELQQKAQQELREMNVEGMI